MAIARPECSTEEARRRHYCATAPFLNRANAAFRRSAARLPGSGEADGGGAMSQYHRLAAILAADVWRSAFS
jgi:hypothetical protein